MSNSVSKKALDLAFKNCSVFYSKETLIEFESVFLRSKFDKYVSKESRIEAISFYAKLGFPVEVHATFQICRDPKDDKFLQLVFDGKVEYLIPGDQDLLELNPFYSTLILSPSEFLAQSEKLSSSKEGFER